MEDIIRICNSMVKFLKFISNKKIENEFAGFVSKLVLRKTFFQNFSLLYIGDRPHNQWI